MTEVVLTAVIEFDVSSYSVRENPSVEPVVRRGKWSRPGPLSEPQASLRPRPFSGVQRRVARRAETAGGGGKPPSSVTAHPLSPAPRAGAMKSPPPRGGGGWVGVLSWAMGDGLAQRPPGRTPGAEEKHRRTQHGVSRALERQRSHTYAHERPPIHCCSQSPPNRSPSAWRVDSRPNERRGRRVHVHAGHGPSVPMRARFRPPVRTAIIPPLPRSAARRPVIGIPRLGNLAPQGVSTALTDPRRDW